MKLQHLVIVCFYLLEAVACKEKKQAAAPVPEVNVVPVGQSNIAIYSEYVGQTFGQTDVEIKPRVEGWIQSIHFKEGGEVKKGQLLYMIQDDELRDREQAAIAQLAQANILLVKAKADLDRVKPLADMNALSKRDLDAAQASFDAQQLWLALAVNKLAGGASIEQVVSILGYESVPSFVPMFRKVL